MQRSRGFYFTDVIIGIVMCTEGRNVVPLAQTTISCLFKEGQKHNPQPQLSPLFSPPAVFHPELLIQATAGPSLTHIHAFFKLIAKLPSL